jgi:hypothetical protein
MPAIKSCYQRTQQIVKLSTTCAEIQSVEMLLLIGGLCCVGFINLNCWVMHPVARVSINIYRNLLIGVVAGVWRQ